jgi:hypothetical protein
VCRIDAQAKKSQFWNKEFANSLQLAAKVSPLSGRVDWTKSLAGKDPTTGPAAVAM